MFQNNSAVCPLIIHVTDTTATVWQVWNDEYKGFN